MSPFGDLEEFREVLFRKYQRRRAAYEDVQWADRELARRRQPTELSDSGEAERSVEGAPSSTVASATRRSIRPERALSWLRITREIEFKD